MLSPRAVLDSLSKAMIATAVMLAAGIALMNPPVDTPARNTAAILLALGIAGLGVLAAAGHRQQQRAIAHRATHRR